MWHCCWVHMDWIGTFSMNMLYHVVSRVSLHKDYFDWHVQFQGGNCYLDKVRNEFNWCLQFQRQNCLFTQNLKQMYGRSRKYKTEKQNTKKGKFSFLSWDPFIHVCCKTTISNFFFFFLSKGNWETIAGWPQFFHKIIHCTYSESVGWGDISCQQLNRLPRNYWSPRKTTTKSSMNLYHWLRVWIDTEFGRILREATF